MRIRTTNPKEDRKIKRCRQIWSGRVCRTRGARWRSRWSRGSSPAPPSAKSSAPEHRPCRTSACCCCRLRRRCWRSCFLRRDGGGACQRWRRRNRGEPCLLVLVAWLLKWRTETERNLWPWRKDEGRRKQRNWEIQGEKQIWGRKERTRVTKN